jgi:hypothetical protein
MGPKQILAVYVGGCAMLMAGPAHAYVDPGTGSMVLQMLIAGAAAGFTTIGLYWSRLVGWFRRGKGIDSSKSD